jgi:hypothetical protein
MHLPVKIVIPECKNIHFRRDMEHHICRPVNNSDVSLGYQFCKNITFILYVYIIYNVRYNKGETPISARIQGISITIELTKKYWYIYPKGVIRSRKLKKEKQHNGQKKKDKRPNNNLQNITSSNTNPTINWVWTQVLRRIKCFLFHMWQPSAFCPFSFGHCVVFLSSIYGFWLPLWYLQTFLTRLNNRSWP